MSQRFTPIDNLIKKYKELKYAASSVSKEFVPLPQPKEIETMQEVVEHELQDEETKPFVTPKAETIKLPPDLKKVGLQPVTQSSFQSYKNIKLPISDDKVIQGLHAPITSSFRWLATLAMYMLQQSHLTLRKIGGRVVRVIKE